jgi:hypothetical protein
MHVDVARFAWRRLLRERNLEKENAMMSIHCQRRECKFVRLTAVVGLMLSAAVRNASAADVIFTIDASQSTFSYAATDPGHGAHVEQSPGSLSTPLTGHFLVRFDPFSGTPSTLEFAGGHGYFQPQSPHTASPGPGGGAAAPANAAGKTSGGELVWAIRDIVWDFHTPTPLAGSGGVFPATETYFDVLSGLVDAQTPSGFDSDPYAPFTDHLTGGTWTISEASAGSGEWTLGFSGHYTYEYHLGNVDPIEVGDFTASAVVVSTAQYGAENVSDVPDAATSAEALGGAGTVGGVSAAFSQPTDGGAFSVQQVPNETGLPQAAVTAAEANPIFALSTEALSVDPQIWNVDFTGSLNGGDVTLLFRYDASLLPAGLDELTLGIWHFNSDTNQWEFGGIVDPEADTIAYTTDNFSPFMLGIQVPEPSSWVLAAAGIAGLLAVARRRRA